MKIFSVGDFHNHTAQRCYDGLYIVPSFNSYITSRKIIGNVEGLMGETFWLVALFDIEQMVVPLAP